MSERTLADSGCFVPMSSAFVDSLDFDDWQVQFVQRFEHAAQFRLVADRPPQFGVSRVYPPADNGDLHAGQPVVPVLSQGALDHDVIDRGAAKIEIQTGFACQFSPQFG